MTLLDRAAIQGLIPHAGAMCLLDRVAAWSEAAITCITGRHTDPGNPMRRPDGTFGAASGIEIAAQAMALHGRLTAPADGPPRPGFLVSLRDVAVHAPVLPPDCGPLTIRAERLLGDSRGATYSFRVTAGETVWLAGRMMVLFVAPLEEMR